MRRDELRLSRLAGLVLLTAALEAVFIWPLGLALWAGLVGKGKFGDDLVWSLGMVFLRKMAGGGFWGENLAMFLIPAAVVGVLRKWITVEGDVPVFLGTVGVVALILSGVPLAWGWIAGVGVLGWSFRRLLW